jgi:hypothetical protein
LNTTLYTDYLSTMGRRGDEPDPLIRKWFKLFDLPGVKKPVAECQACFKWRRAQNTCRLRAHLLSECTKHQGFLQFTERSEKFKQSTIGNYLPAVDNVKKARLFRKLALALFVTGKSFSKFEDPTWIDFFEELGYTPPT